MKNLIIFIALIFSNNSFASEWTILERVDKLTISIDSSLISNAAIKDFKVAPVKFNFGEIINNDNHSFDETIYTLVFDCLNKKFAIYGLIDLKQGQLVGMKKPKLILDESVIKTLAFKDASGPFESSYLYTCSYLH